MTPEYHPQSEVLSALGKGATLITANKRLSGTLSADYALHATVRGARVWNTPDVLPVQAWLQRCWEAALLGPAGTELPRLLSTTQERALWEGIVKRGLGHRPLLEHTGCARKAQAAWNLAQTWSVEIGESHVQAQFRYHVDSEVFLGWAQQFEHRCKERRWLSQSTLTKALISPFSTGGIAVPDTLILFGFDELTPALMTLLNVLKEADCLVRWLEPEGRHAIARQTACADSRSEALAMAQWARRRFMETPDASIGIVVPELSSQRAIITRALDECLSPEALAPGQGHLERPYNISLGLPLSEHPVARSAVRLLALLEPRITLTQTTQLLRSPFIGGWRQETGARAMLDARLRESGELSVTLKHLCYLAGQPDKPYSCPILARHLEDWMSLRTTLADPAPPSVWATQYATLHKTLGWCQGRPLSSNEFQAIESWRELLNGLSSLDTFVPPLSAVEARTLLSTAAQDRTFQAQSTVAPIQVMGVLESVGQQFDHLWVMGLHDGVWPRPPTPNPFIPLPLQRARDLPHASEARELRFARTLTQRLLTSANEVVVSYPGHCGDEALGPSPLIANLEPIPIETLCPDPITTWRDTIRRASQRATLSHDPAPPLAAEATGGGSGIFKYQAACPFRAFSEYRLGAHALGTGEIGLDPRVRGALIHRVLEKVWQELGAQNVLLNMDGAELTTLVRRAVDTAIKEAGRHHPDTLSGRFRELESARLFAQVMEWLDLERTRPPFRVKGREQVLQTRIGRLEIRVIIDRIDELEDGQLALIDYKTGSVSPTEWFGERPDEPQLPLYSMAVDGPVAALAFAQLKTGDTGFKGIAAEQDLIPRIKSYDEMPYTREMATWPEVLERWQVTMIQLAESFASGDATVDPKAYPKTCGYCPLPTLCRVDERHAEDPGLGADEAES